MKRSNTRCASQHPADRVPACSGTTRTRTALSMIKSLAVCRVLWLSTALTSFSAAGRIAGTFFSDQARQAYRRWRNSFDQGSDQSHRRHALRRNAILAHRAYWSIRVLQNPASRACRYTLWQPTGHALSRPRKMTEFFIGPGGRTDAIAVGPPAGEHPMRTISFQNEAWRPPEPVLQLAVITFDRIIAQHGA